MGTFNNNSAGNELVIGITMGDPGGIGPEVIVKALADPFVRREAKFIIFGTDEQLEYAADTAEIEPYWLRHPHEKISRHYPRNVALADYDEYPIAAWLHAPNKIAGEASIRFCLDAVDAALDGIIDALVTAPISKHSWRTDKQTQLATRRRGRLAGPYRNVGRTVQVAQKSDDVCRRAFESRPGDHTRRPV